MREFIRPFPFVTQDFPLGDGAYHGYIVVCSAAERSFFSLFYRVWPVARDWKGFSFLIICNMNNMNIRPVVPCSVIGIADPPASSPPRRIPGCPAFRSGRCRESEFYSYDKFIIIIIIIT